jgi:NADH-quinone oxidoreductase subunit L
MGIPPFGGFWTKDAVLSAAFQSNQYILYAIGLATVVLTAFYTTRMLGITFAGKPSRHVEDLEKEGKRVHEAGLTMLVPYVLLGVASLGLGLYPLYVQPLTTYLQGTFPSPPYAITGGPPGAFSITDIVLLSASAGLAAIGALIGYLVYFRRPYTLPAKYDELRGFLWHRWYIDAIYYKLFVNGLSWISRVIYRYIEVGIWDRLSSTVARDVIGFSVASQKVDSEIVDGAVNDVASAGSRLSNLLRRLQSGVTEQYVITFAIGIFLLLLYMIFFIGVR